MARSKKIPQPSTTTVKTPQAGVSLVWAQDFSKRSTAQFDLAQKFVDSECIRRMVRYTPARNNIMTKSATLGTKIGSGHIYYASPYARYQYYGYLMVSSITGSPWARNGEKKVTTDRMLNYSTARHPEAQRLWFETMKSNSLKAIKSGAQRIAGGASR